MGKVRSNKKNSDTRIAKEKRSAREGKRREGDTSGETIKQPKSADRQTLGQFEMKHGPVTIYVTGFQSHQL